MNDARRPLKKPDDLKHHILLQYDDPDVRHPWLHWKTCSKSSASPTCVRPGR